MAPSLACSLLLLSAALLSAPSVSSATLVSVPDSIRVRVRHYSKPSPTPLDPTTIPWSSEVHSFERSWTSEDVEEQEEESNTRGYERRKRAWGTGWTQSKTTLESGGTSGVSAMQISVINDNEIIIFDKSEANPLKYRNKSVWGALYNIQDHSVRALPLITNTFCAGGGWLSNGTMVVLGGTAREGLYDGDAAENGLQGVRLINPCSGVSCDVYENPGRIHLTSNRWYPSSSRLEDGSVIIFGGMTLATFNNYEEVDNPTIEFFPPKGDGMQIYSSFLHEALNSNLFPITYTLTDGRIFVAANTRAMIYDWKTDKEYRLPGIPNGVRINYPASAASVLLPLTIANQWTPEVLICGGSTADVDRADSWHLSSQTPASKQCIRMVLDSAGISRGWVVEQMPEARVMGDALLTPDGKVFIVNGAQTGVAGYGNVPDAIGQSNADKPNYRPLLYDPIGDDDNRWSVDFPSSKIERLYHSSATLVPDGRILVTGSNPNGGVTTQTYRTRYEVEFFSPPYMILPRPTYTGLPTNILAGRRYRLEYTLPTGTQNVRVMLMDLGYSTHGVHMTHRLVELVTDEVSSSGCYFIGPTALRYQPGFAWLYLLADDVPSAGFRTMVGDGNGPPVNQAAIDNLLAHT